MGNKHVKNSAYARGGIDILQLGRGRRKRGA